MDISQERNTKQKILDVSLELFSEKGFDAVSMEEIARAVGIKAPSVYKHFSSKKEIFSSCLSRLREHCQESHLVIPMNTDDCTSPEACIKKILHQFDFILTDSMTKNFWSICAMESSRNKEIANMVEELFFRDTFMYCRDMLQNLVDLKILRNEDLKVMTIQFASPITSFISLCRVNPEYWEKAKENVADHIQAFYRLYAFSKGNEEVEQ